jgi:hypothetical protein
MKKVNRLQIFLLFIVAISAMTACRKEKQDNPLINEESFAVAEKIMVPTIANSSGATEGKSFNMDYNTFYGPVVQIGNGHLRSWINITRSDNTPLAMGVEYSKGALQNLPTSPLDFATNTFVLKLHQKAKAVTPIDHITVNWEPEGHEPPGIYDVPHFDIHFYKISEAAQMAITGIPGPPPPAGYLPASYVIEGATVPQMGTHWLDPASPELPPTLAPFTHTFIYGSNNGQVIFLEPMITRAFLLSGTAVTKAFPQPILFAPANTYYPQVYKIWETADKGRNYIALTDFAWR